MYTECYGDIDIDTHALEIELKHFESSRPKNEATKLLDHEDLLINIPIHDKVLRHHNQCI